jgi:hypothetical protein
LTVNVAEAVAVLPQESVTVQVTVVKPPSLGGAVAVAPLYTTVLVLFAKSVTEYAIVVSGSTPPLTAIAVFQAVNCV